MQISAELVAGYLSLAALVVGILAGFVSLVTQLVKELPGLVRVPTSLVVMVLSIIVTIVAVLIAAVYFGYAITWYMVVGAFALSLFVWGVAQMGWEGVKGIFRRFVPEKGANK